MKIRVLRDEFAKSVSEAVRFVSARAQLPVLNNIVLRAKGVTLNVEATNLEMSIATSVGAKITTEGDIAVPGKMISEIVGNLRSESVELESDGEILKITADGFTGRVAGMNTADFPEIVARAPEKAVALPAEAFVNALKYTLFSVSTDTTRVVLTGVLLVNGKSGVEFVSTDGFRLSKFEYKGNKIEGFEKLTLPKNVLSEIVRMAGDNKKIEFSFDNLQNLVVFGLSGRVIASRVVEGSFPDYTKIIPETSVSEVIVGKGELLTAVKTASVFARESANSIRFVLKGGELSIASESSQGRQEIALDGKCAGEEMEILFNYRFVEEFLNVVRGESIKIKLLGVNAAGVFTDPSELNFLHLIMPVKG
jgi:DNA polymerase-3 subunit beta